MLNEAIDAAIKADAGTRQQIIEDLTRWPEETLSNIMAGYQPKRHWATIVAIIRAIGYPANEPIFPWLVAHIDRNSPAWYETKEAVNEIPAAALAPYLIQALWPPDVADPSWAYDVESICALLTQLDRAYAWLCAPMLVKLLDAKIDPTMLDPTFLLDVLELVLPDAENYALPSLFAFVERAPDGPLASQAQQLIARYDASGLVLYERAIDTRTHKQK